MRRRLAAIVLTAVMIMSLVACGAPKSEDSGKEGTSKASVFPGTSDSDMVTLNVTSEPTEMNSLRVSDAIAQSILAHCMAGLTRLDENDAPVADMAESWDISEDNTVYTMHLREDAKWSNGEPVTANDFYYAWKTQMIPETGAVFASFLYDNIKNGQAFYNGEIDESKLGLKVIDDYTLEIEWSHPMPETNGLFCLSQPFYLPVNEKAYTEIGDQEYAKDADKIVTNGAYKITEWVHDDHMTMEKSEDYYDASQISIPKVKLVMIGDANTGLNAFMAGEIDMTNIYSEQIAQVKEKSEEAAQAYVDGGSWFLNFNMKDENLSNANLRKALSYSIDIQSLLDNVINDGSIAADGLVPSVIAGADGKNYSEERGSLFAYDKEAAKDYLDKALKELGKTKEELKLTFWGTDTTYNQNQSAYLQQQWKENLGLDVELKSMPTKALTEARYNGEYTFCVNGEGPSENDPITFLDNYRSDSLNNTAGYNNPKFDELIENSRQESDSKKRQDILIKAEQMLVDEMVMGPMYFTCTAYAISEKVENVVRTPFQFFNVRGADIVTK